ncbi:MAG: tetratricopeptide repeat protein [Armatimonadota bacterium]
MSLAFEAVLQIRHVPGSDPPQFTVVRLMDGRSGEAAVITPPADVLVAGTSNLLAELRWYLESFLDYPFPPETERAERVLAALTAWGEAAFAVLFDQRQTGGWLAAATARGEEQLLLQISSDDPAILAWPWEALRDPAMPGALAHACRIERRLNRHLQDLRPADLPNDAVNILLVIARPYERDVRYRSISRPLVELIYKEQLPARVTMLRPPTFAALQAHLREHRDYYHILHFDGHGAYAEHPSGSVSSHTLRGPEGRLVFETDEGDPDPVEVERLSTLLREVAVPVVVLNACQSGMMGPDAPDPFASVAAGLLQGGAHAVVAMAYSLYVSGAQQFLPAFYRRLFVSGDVAEAVRAGRRQMLSENRRSSPRGKFPLDDWLVPVLYRQGQFNLGFVREASVSPREECLPEEVREIDNPAKYPHGFIGRDQTLLALERALRKDAAGVLIHGLGGVGKSTLARGFCAWLAQTGGLGDGCFWLSFQEIRSAEYVINRLGEQFFGPQFGAAPLEERFASLVAMLREHRVLIVWDNFESARGIEGTEITPNLPPEDRELLAHLLASLRGGASKVLITSRSLEDWLGPQRRFIVQLGGLDGEERWEYCAAILCDLDLQARQDDPDLVGLVEQLRGHPLAMRAMLSRLDRMTPRQALDALQNNLAVFQTVDDEVARLYATISFATESLSLTDRALLVPLAMHEGFVNAKLLEIIAKHAETAWSRAQIDRVLATLATAGLLRNIGQMTYEIHPLLTSYLRTHAPAGTTSTISNAWECAFVNVMGNIADDITLRQLHEQRGVFHLHHANFRYALTMAAQLELVVDFMALANSLGKYARNTRNFTEAERLFLQFSQYANQHDMSHEEARAYFELGLVAQQRRDFAAAEGWYRQSLELSERLGDESIAVSVYFQMGWIALESRNCAAAEAWYHKSLALIETLGDTNDIAHIYHQLGMTAEGRRDFVAAETWYRKSMEIKEKLGDEHGAANTYHHLGLVAHKRQDFAAAEAWYRKSLMVSERLGDEYFAAMTYTQLGIIARERQDFTAAELLYLKSLGILEKISDEYSTATCCVLLGQLALDKQYFEQAGEWSIKAILIFQRFNETTRIMPAYFVYKRAYTNSTKDMQLKLRTMWQEAELGQFPEWDEWEEGELMTFITMSEIQALPDEKVINLLDTIARYRFAEIQLTDGKALMAALASEVRATPQADGATPGEVARLALQLLAEDPEMREIIIVLARSPQLEQFAIGEAIILTAVVTAAIKILSTHVRYEVDKDGNRTLLIDAKSSSEGLIKALVEKLLALKSLGVS